MGKNLLSLARKLEHKSKVINKKASEAAIMVAEKLVMTLASSTPVDTSQALSNWIVEINARPEDSIGPHFPGKFGSTQGMSLLETIAEAKRVLALKDPGETIYISNLLSYIRDLNDGTYPQHPVGWIEGAIFQARRELKTIKLRM